MYPSHKTSCERFPALRAIPSQKARDVVAMSCGLGDNCRYRAEVIRRVLKTDVSEVLLLAGEGFAALRGNGQHDLADELEAVFAEVNNPLNN